MNWERNKKTVVICGPAPQAFYLEIQPQESHWDVLINGEKKDEQPTEEQAKQAAQNLVPYRMKTIADYAKNVLAMPYLTVYAADNLMSDVTIRGAKTTPDQWPNGIFHNAIHFIAMISPEKGHRWYTGGNVTVEVLSCHGFPKFRKYTGPHETAIRKLKTWMQS